MTLLKRKYRKEEVQVEVVDYSRFVPFHKTCTICEHTLTSNDELTPIRGIDVATDSLYPVPGFSAIYRLIGNGTHAPVFSEHFKKSQSSGDYDRTLGKLNLVTFLFDGVNFWYTINVESESFVTNRALPASNSFFEELKALGFPGVALPIGAYAPLILNRTLADGTIHWQSFYIDRAMTVTGVRWMQRLQGAYTAADYNGVAIYSISGPTLTKISESANDGNIWKGAGYSRQTKAFPAPVSLSKGVYYVAFLYNQSAETTAPNIYAWNTGFAVSQDLTNGNHRLSGVTLAQTALPATAPVANIVSPGTDAIYGVWLY